MKAVTPFNARRQQVARVLRDARKRAVSSTYLDGIFGYGVSLDMARGITAEEAVRVQTEMIRRQDPSFVPIVPDALYQL